jgi:Tc toxin complex TcA C-terminal TcB-binding domain
MPPPPPPDVALFPSVRIDPIPTDGAGFHGATITVKGTADCRRDSATGPSAIDSIFEVAVRLGSSGEFLAARPTGPLVQGRRRWSTWITDALAITTEVVNHKLEITARVSAGPSDGTVDAQNPVPVLVEMDKTPPGLRTVEVITQPVENGTANFTLAGTTEPNRAPVGSVEWKLGEGPFALATPKAQGDWSSWTVAVKVSAAGKYQVSMKATDGEGNVTPEKKVTLNAVETFRPPDPSDVFSQAAYLFDLLHFANQRIVDERRAPLTQAMLTAAYHQPFDELTDPKNREPATATVLQVRVCVEVLRAFLGRSAPPGQEASYRERAYATLLRSLGTSRDEIRSTRGDDAARARLADRLGVDRPDRLDQLMLPAEEVTENNLERLFGLQDTSRNPLLGGKQPLLLTWQLARLGARWQQQDDTVRVFGNIPVPIIDPDLLVESDFRTPDKADPAFALRNARRTEVTDLLRQIDDLRKGTSAPLAAFDAVVTHFVAKVEDLRTLLADHQAGKDISPRLTEKRLDLAAFLRLMRIRDLASSGTILDADWADVQAIAAQAAKLERYPVWRSDEKTKGLNLGPDFFVPTDPAKSVDLPEWRTTPQQRRAWQTTLQSRISQRQNVVQALKTVVDTAEAEALLFLRDLLAAIAGDAAHGLLIDLAAGAVLRTTRLAEAIKTVQGALFAVRAGAFTAGHPAAGWNLASTYSEDNFDRDWAFWGSHETWQGAMRVFIYPESHLLPTLRPDIPTLSKRTSAFENLVETLRKPVRITPAQAREAARVYLEQLRKESDLTLDDSLKSPSFEMIELLRDSELADRQALCARLMGTFDNHSQAPSHLKEIFYFVPLLCALQLQRSGEFLSALDWLKTVYAYHLPPGRLTADKLRVDENPVLPDNKPLPDRRQIYYGLTLDERIPTRFERPVDWPREGFNPHEIVEVRANALTRFTVISLVRCFAGFADAEFTRDSDESLARARALYQTSLDLLGLVYPAPPADSQSASPYRPDPIVEALRLHAGANLRKLRLGHNIAGLERPPSAEPAAGSAVAPGQPTPYRYATLVARAKELTQTAAQMEAALLSALEKRDAESYSLLKATQDLEVASATVDLHNLRVKEANDGVDLATLQRGRAEIQFKHFDDLIEGGTSRSEKAGMVLGVLGSVLASAASGGGSLATLLVGATAAGGIGGVAIGAGIGLVSGFGSLFGQISSNKRREEEWRLNRNLAQQDEDIGDGQIAIATDQVAVATQEQLIARIQMEHAGATVQFLAGKFTNIELYEFMSEILDGVYRFFLQQATALAQLAENQLAFERQEPPQGVIQGDYYAPPDGGPDRRGITGSARLLADIVQLDQHAFLTDRRKLQLTKTFSLARLFSIEFEQFRQTGVLTIGTPQAMFDRDFPGHYLRLVKRVRTSVIALITPTDGIHATLSTSGTSRVVIGGDTFRNVVVLRDPETIGLSSPRDATGLFELVPDSQPELLLPFEGSGVDTVWRFELPRAANPFDYSTIADILLTIEYTALNSFDYRQQVIQTLDPELSLDRPFSFRQQFPDQWYDLNNPDQTPAPMLVRFKTARGDFLPNVDDLKIENLVLYFAPTNGQTVEIGGVRLLFKNSSDQTPVGGSADSVDGVISTRRTNGSNWLPMTGNRPPIGDWELALPTDETTKKLFKNEEIADILFVITYSGRAPEWPR